MTKLKTALKITTTLFSCALMTSIALADTLTKSDISAKLQHVFKKRNVNLEVKKIEASPLEGFYQVITNSGLFYVEKTGDYVFSGSLLDLSNNMENLTQSRLRIDYVKQIEATKDHFITYRAPDEKHEILVFYDTSCGFCQKLHNQIAQYNALGITVHYAAYPRNGLIDPQNNTPTRAAQTLANIWCAPDAQKQQAFNMAARNQPLDYASCDAGIAEQYALGQTLGVRGTPAIFDMNARQVTRGYAPPQQMLASLEVKS